MQWIMENGVVTVAAVFVFVSALLTAASALLQGLGKSVPGWLGTAIEVAGKVVGFLNGNFAKAKPKAE